METTVLCQVKKFLDAKASRAPKTVAFYRAPLRQFAEFAPGWPPTDSAINAYLADLRKRGRQQHTIWNHYRAIRIWLAWLVKRGILSENPIDLVEKPLKPDTIPRAPHLETVRRFFEAIEQNDGWIKDRDRAIFMLLLDTGLRLGELTNVKLNDIDLIQREIWIPATKTYSQRFVVFSKAAYQALLLWLGTRAELDIPSKIRSLFVSKPRSGWRPLTDSGIRQAKDRYLNRANLPHFRVHDLRHAYAIYTLRHGGDLEDIQHQLGHKNIATTARYLRADNVDRLKRHNHTTPLSDLKE